MSYIFYILGGAWEWGVFLKDCMRFNASENNGYKAIQIYIIYYIYRIAFISVQFGLFSGRVFSSAFPFFRKFIER